MASKYGLDKFYTKTEVAEKLINAVDINNYSSIIEPSAGNGSFSKQINNCSAIDIEPESEEITKQDFFDFNGNNLKGPVLVIGNPPFGRNGSLALAFIKKASEFADTIAFILPKSFKKQSFYDKIPLNFWLEKQIDLEDNSFMYEEQEVLIPCVFQVYVRKSEEREKQEKLKPKNFAFTDKEKANISLRRVGVYAGKAFEEVKEKSESTHYFIKSDNPKLFIKIANSIIWEHDNTVGPRSISKQELIRAIDKKIKN